MKKFCREVRKTIALGLTLAILMLAGCGEVEDRESFGIFIGVVPEESDDALADEVELFQYDTVVIDAQYFTAEQIASLHEKGQVVYSYLNVGSLEEWRDYAAEFSDLTIGVYENWEDESWVDVSNARWQQFVVGELASDLVGKGVDGFFLDNFDVYYLNETDAVYEGLCEILEGLQIYGKKILVNGGDTFVGRFLEEMQEPATILTGVNQESVFTSIDFETESFSSSDDETRHYYQEYLGRCKENGLEVYLTEYTSDEKLATEIETYCAENGFSCYISDSLELD